MRYFIDGNIKAVPAVVDATNGDALLEGHRAVGCGVVLYLASGDDISFTIATSQPAAPADTVTLEGPARIEEYLGPKSNIYVLAITGTPKFRQF
ncbi:MULTISPECIES: hypothetical protein [unclassified Sphingomonas]|uniref:hypothetical protein n=1 Tax=unclassified Sphingomonas TaxID=196159 RepID=UPI0006F96D50|nr:MULTISPECIES: hypothetical protein [unclassified Sphingomonas]KQX19352.1 hypothetical protein ASD17_12480 [Sphingomonas sp. Root1294]KQY65555.1 hypothetical protein ASD39_15680 [Sphingomonas sp. Root50]KRB95145.1 hypothetical protein ASE22_04380 [Sphingomonas sp. Root720]